MGGCFSGPGGHTSGLGLSGGRRDEEKQRDLRVERTASPMGWMGAPRQRQQSRTTSRESGRGIVGQVGVLAEVKYSHYGPC